MSRGVAVPLVVVVVVVMVVVGVGPCVAGPPRSDSITHQELMMSIIVNQMAILKGMNESSSSSASHGNELNQLQQDLEKAWQAFNKTNEEIMNERNESKAWREGINATLHTGISDLNENIVNEVQGRVRAMTEMNATIQSLDSDREREIRQFLDNVEDEINNTEEGMNQTIYTEIESVNKKLDAVNSNIERLVGEMNESRERENQRMQRQIDRVNARRESDSQSVKQQLQAIQNTVATHHQRPSQDELYVLHNDTYSSLCDGDKVLYGGRGGFEVTSSGNYANNIDCSWTVTLPEGSRPIFVWRYFDIEKCTNCANCDYVYVRDVEHNKWYYDFCGDTPPDTSFFTVKNNKFEVKFHSNGSKTGRGFRLWYRAVSSD